MKKDRQILCAAIGAMLVIATSSCFRMPGDGTDAPSSFADRREQDRDTEWSQTLPAYIIPRMCDYYRLHPDRFKPTGHGEEIDIAGFAAFIKNDGYFKTGTHCFIVNGGIFDPWGDPLDFVQDLNMDGFIEAKGERRIVLNLGTSGINQEHHFGICKDRPFKTGYGQPWERIFAATY